jgi:hypothetical protein
MKSLKGATDSFFICAEQKLADSQKSGKSYKKKVSTSPET